MAVLDEDPERPYARDTARPETFTNKRFRSSSRPPECSVHGPQSDAWLPLVSESRYTCPIAEVVRTAGQARACVNSGASNDVRAREGDYFVGSRAPRTQGQVRSTRGEQKQRNHFSKGLDLAIWVKTELWMRPTNETQRDCSMDPREKLMGITDTRGFNLHLGWFVRS